MKFRAFFPAVIAATCILSPSAAQAFTFQIGPNSESSNDETTGPSIRLNFAQPLSSNPSSDVRGVGIGLSGSGNSNRNNPLPGNRPQGGLTAGQQTEVRFSFSTARTSPAANDFAQAFEREISSGNLNVAARFQEVNGRGRDTSLRGRVTNGDRPTKVPEPAAVGALGLAAAGLGLLKKKQSAEAGDQEASA